MTLRTKLIYKLYVTRTHFGYATNLVVIQVIELKRGLSSSLSRVRRGIMQVGIEGFCILLRKRTQHLEALGHG